MFKSQNDKLKLIQKDLLILGIDIAKKSHWAQPMLHNGIFISKPFHIKNNKDDFESLLAKIELLKKDNSCRTVIVGLEPTGHYWKPLAWFLIKNRIMVVLINPFHVKKAKELDDNTQTKNDPKDAGIIGRLVRDGRFSEVYLPEGPYANLRILTNTRVQLRTKLNAVLNIITATLDEYFPEFKTVFKDLTGKTAMHVLFHCPFPDELIGLGVEGILAEFRKVTKITVGLKRARLLYETALRSIGIPSNSAVKIKLQVDLKDLQFLTEQITTIEANMERELVTTGISGIF